MSVLMLNYRHPKLPSHDLNVKYLNLGNNLPVYKNKVGKLPVHKKQPKLIVFFFMIIDKKKKVV